MLRGLLFIVFWLPVSSGEPRSKSFTSSRISGAKFTKPLDPQSLARRSTFSIGELSNSGNNPVQLVWQIREKEQAHVEISRLV